MARRRAVGFESIPAKDVAAAREHLAVVEETLAQWVLVSGCGRLGKIRLVGGRTVCDPADLGEEDRKVYDAHVRRARRLREGGPVRVYGEKLVGALWPHRALLDEGRWYVIDRAGIRPARPPRRGERAGWTG